MDGAEQRRWRVSVAEDANLLPHSVQLFAESLGKLF